jgi:RNA polymerase-binding transcription factor DksA
MSDFDDLKQQLEARLADLVSRSSEIESELGHQLDPDLEEQSIDLEDDEALSGIDEVLRKEIVGIRNALGRIDNGTYGVCVKCGGKIGKERLKALPTATTCIKCV